MFDINGYCYYSSHLEVETLQHKHNVSLVELYKYIVASIKLACLITSHPIP